MARLRRHHHRWRLAPGHPCQPRQANSVVGKHQGVAYLLPGPVRSLNAHLDPTLVASSRLQMASLCLAGLWLQGANVYGYTWLYTQPSVAEAVSHLLAIGRGPRFLARDFNHGLDDLPATHLLLERGWLDLQDWLMHRQGLAPVATCKEATRPDFLLLSLEFMALGLEGRVLQGLFPDHATLAFRFRTEAQPWTSWPMPLPLPTDHPPSAVTPVNFQAAATVQALTVEYARHCSQLEQAHAHLIPSGRGRGAHLCSRTTWPNTAPPPHLAQCPPAVPRQTRLQDALYLQLRCLDSLRRQLLGSATRTPAWQERLSSQWAALQAAHGFPCPFLPWLLQATMIETALIFLQAGPPTVDQAQMLHRAAACVQAHRARCKALHTLGTRLTMRELRKASPPTISLLKVEQRTTIAYVDPSTGLAALSHSLEVDTSRPVLIGEAWHQVGAASEDALWLPEVDAGMEGATVVQATMDSSFATGATPANLLGHLLVSGGIASTGGLDANPAQGRACPNSHCGNVPAHHHRPAARACSGLEAFRGYGHRRPLSSRHPPCPVRLSRWACRLALYRQVEKVGPLAPADGALAASHRRPIQIYSLVYRIWSSIRAKQAVRALAPWLPPGIAGVPHKGVTHVTYAIQAAIDYAHTASAALTGVVKDVIKAFDALPGCRSSNLPGRLASPWAFCSPGTALLSKALGTSSLRGQSSGHCTPVGLRTRLRVILFGDDARQPCSDASLVCNGPVSAASLLRRQLGTYQSLRPSGPTGLHGRRRLCGCLGLGHRCGQAASLGHRCTRPCFASSARVPGAPSCS